MPRFTRPYLFYPAGADAFVSHHARGLQDDQTPDADGPLRLGALTAISGKLAGDFAYGNGASSIGFEGELFQGASGLRYWLYSFRDGGPLTLPQFTDFWFADAGWRGAEPPVAVGEAHAFPAQAISLEIGVTWLDDQRVYPFHQGDFARVSRIAAGDDASIWRLSEGRTAPLDRFSAGSANFLQIYWRVSVPALTGTVVWVAPLDSDSSFTLGLGTRGSLAESRIVRTRAPRHPLARSAVAEFVTPVVLGGTAVDDAAVAWTVESITEVGRQRYWDVTLSRETEAGG